MITIAMKSIDSRGVRYWKILIIPSLSKIQTLHIAEYGSFLVLHATRLLIVTNGE